MYTNNDLANRDGKINVIYSDQIIQCIEESEYEYDIEMEYEGCIKPEKTNKIDDSEI